MTLISTACSWVSILGGQKAAIIAQVGQFYFDEVGQYYSGANTKLMITIQEMVVLAPNHTTEVMRSLAKLDYPWSSAEQITNSLSMQELQCVKRQITREAGS